jgi:diadenosine tetraphosphate (Ap4A) HIT family hydrolase
MTCLFCNAPEERIFYRDDLVIGLWDGFPVSPYHALLIPKRHVPTWCDATLQEQSALMAAALASLWISPQPSVSPRGPTLTPRS